MNVLSGISSDKPIMIEFGCGLTPLSFDRKLILQVDTGADANAINKKTFDQLFPEVELEDSTFILKNFDERLIKPIGSFRCFLRWKGHKYRVQIEVMGADTPNILSRETTFMMGILKKCFITEKVSIEQNTPNSLISGPTGPTAEERTDPSTECVFCHSAPPTEETSTEGVFCHSDPSTKQQIAIQFRQRKYCPRKEYLAIQFCPRKLYFAIQIRSRKHLSILQALLLRQISQKHRFHKVVAPINHHFLLQIYLSLRIRWNLPMQTCSKVLANSQVNPTS